MSFFQDAPRLGNQFHEDRVLRRYLERVLPDALRRAAEPSLERMGELAAGRLLELARECRNEEPEHVPYDPWGRRVDEVRGPKMTVFKMKRRKGYRRRRGHRQDLLRVRIDTIEA